MLPINIQTVGKMWLQTIFIVILGVQFSVCSDHVYGTSISGGSKVLFDKVVFVQNNDVPKNYTLIFKYIGSETSPNITYAKFIVSGTSDGGLEVDNANGKEKTLLAQLNIINGTDVKVSAAIYGPSVSVHQDFSSFRSSGQSSPKTMTVVYVHNTTQTRNRKVILGRRQSGDQLLDFQTHNVTLGARFAEKEFEFSGSNKQYITAVGLSFDSPSAIAFVNSTFLAPNKVNVIAYDLNTAFFSANMSIYGYDSYNKPLAYKPIVLSQKSQK